MSSADDIFEGEKVISKPLLVNSKAKDLVASEIKIMLKEIIFFIYVSL